jgi:hypothetical protein
VNSTLLEVAGWLGTATVLGSYALMRGGKLRADGLAYSVANVAGPLLIGVAAASKGLYSVVALQAAWGTITLLTWFGPRGQRATPAPETGP